MIEKLHRWPSGIRELGWTYIPRRLWHLIRPGRVAREREALRIVAGASRRLVDTPLGGGLSVRQIAALPSDLRTDIYIGLVSGTIRLALNELERLCADPAGVRSEYPELFN